MQMRTHFPIPQGVLDGWSFIAIFDVALVWVAIVVTLFACELDFGCSTSESSTDAPLRHNHQSTPTPTTHHT